MILALETSCDETAAAVVTHDGRVLSNIVSSQADLHAKYGGIVPEIASRRHLELIAPVVREALEQAGATLDDVDRVVVAPAPARAGRPSRRPHRLALSAAGGGRAAVCLPARERRAHDARRRPEPFGAAHPRLDARRRGRRGVRQGCAPARA